MCKLPIEKILALVAIVRSGELLEKRAEALGLLGEILIAVSLCMGGNDPVVTQNSLVPTELDACLDQLDIMLSEPSTQAINPALLALLLKIAELLISKYL